MGKLSKKFMAPTQNGLHKVKFWIMILLTILSANLGLRIGVVFPKNISVSYLAWDAIWTTVIDFVNNLRVQMDQNRTEFFVSFTIVVIGIIAISYLTHKFRPKDRKNVDFSQIRGSTAASILMYAVFFGFGVYSGTLNLTGFFAPVSFSIGTMVVNMNMQNLLSFELLFATGIVVARLIYVLQDVYVKRNSEDYIYFEQNKKSVLIKTTLLGIVVFGLGLWVPDFWGFTIPALAIGGDLLGHYTAILSLTFISISVMSMLSDRSVVIYWENIAEGKLIKPVFGSFAAYTYYSMGAALAAGVCVALGNTTAFIFFCIADILSLVLLTFTMVDVYYDRENKKLQREIELQEDTEDYLWYMKDQMLRGEEQQNHRINPANNESYTQRELKGKQIGFLRYEEKMTLLCQNIRRAQDEHDLLYLREVYALYQKCFNCFNTPGGRQVVHALFANCTAESWPLMIQSLKVHLEDMIKNADRENNPFGSSSWSTNLWNQDERLWAALANSAYFPKWLKLMDSDPLDSRELADFLFLLMQRFAVLYNDLVTYCNCQEKHTEGYRSIPYLAVERDNLYIEIRTENGEPYDIEEIDRVFVGAFEKIVPGSNFAGRLLWVVYVILENLHDPESMCLLDNDVCRFPFITAFSDYLCSFGFSEEEKAVWKDHFGT